MNKKKLCVSAYLIICLHILLVMSANELSSEDLKIIRGPYLQNLTSDSITLRWRTKKASDSAVYYGTTAAKLNSVNKNSSFVTEHEVRLNGLKPATTYYYKIGTISGAFSQAAGDQYFVTAPKTGTGKPVKIWVLGDSGTGEGKALEVRDAYLKFNKPADLLLMLGDNAYESGKDSEYQKAVFNAYTSILRKTVLWPSIGNHDAKSSDSVRQTGAYFNIFSLPKNGEAGGAASGTEAYYSFNYGRIHLICLDSSESDLGADKPMLKWLDKDLTQVRGSGQTDWTIVFLHHPPFSKGSNDSDKDPISIELRKNFVSVFEKHGVDLVLSGHSHAYERSYMLKGLSQSSSDVNETHIISPDKEGVEYLKKSEGTVYVVAGSSAKLNTGAMNHPAIYKSLAMYGSLLIEITQNNLEVRFINQAGEVKDFFRIKKEL